MTTFNNFDRNTINIVIIGPVSAGKSTFTNMLFVEQLSDMKIKRTTAQPQLYHEFNIKLDVKMDNIKQIRKNNRKINEEIMKKTINDTYELKYSDIKEIEYMIPKIFEFRDHLKDDVYLSVYNTPSLNDIYSKNVYYTYIQTNFHKFDVVFFLLDINSCMNTSDERDMLKMILTEIKKNKDTYGIDSTLIVLVNKCDEMEYNEERQMYAPYDEELLEMFDQGISIIKSHIKEIHPETIYDVLPISCEDSYIYRMYKKNPKMKFDIKYLNKFGSNEYGKTRWNRLSTDKKQKKISKMFNEFDYIERIKQTGYMRLKNKMKKVLNSSNQYNFLINHIKYDIDLINDYNKVDISVELEQLNKYLVKVNILIHKFKKSATNNGFVLDKTQKFIKAHESKPVNKYLNVVSTKNTVATSKSNKQLQKKIKKKVSIQKQYQIQKKQENKQKKQENKQKFNMHMKYVTTSNSDKQLREKITKRFRIQKQYQIQKKQEQDNEQKLDKQKYTNEYIKQFTTIDIEPDDTSLTKHNQKSSSIYGNTIYQINSAWQTI